MRYNKGSFSELKVTVLALICVKVWCHEFTALPEGSTLIDHGVSHSNTWKSAEAIGTQHIIEMTIVFYYLKAGEISTA